METLPWEGPPVPTPVLPAPPFSSPAANTVHYSPLLGTLAAPVGALAASPDVVPPGQATPPAWRTPAASPDVGPPGQPTPLASRTLEPGMPVPPATPKPRADDTNGLDVISIASTPMKVEPESPAPLQAPLWESPAPDSTKAPDPDSNEAPDKPALQRAKPLPAAPETPQNPSLLNTPKGKTPKRGRSRSPATEELLKCKADDSIS